MKSAHRSARAVTVALVVALSMTLAGGNALAVTSTPTSTSSGISTAATSNEATLVFNQGNSPERKITAAELSTRLVEAGYIKGEVVQTPQGPAHTYILKDGAFTISYLVPVDPEVIVLAPELNAGDRKIHFGWDNGPRIYMTGTDFWNLGKVGLQEMCGKLPWGAVSCGKFVDRLWTENLTGPGRILNDGRCWDLSQTLNVGWRPAPPEKCA